jgi:hypothetical protein
MLEQCKSGRSSQAHAWLFASDSHSLLPVAGCDAAHCAWSAPAVVVPLQGMRPHAMLKRVMIPLFAMSPMVLDHGRGGVIREIRYSR